MKKKQLGHVEYASISITEPMKLEIENMKFNNIMLLVGMNGTGKTLILKLTWLFATFANYFLISRTNNLPFSTNEVMQFLFDNTFTGNNFDGRVSFVYEGVNVISTYLEKGKVVTVKIELEEDIEGGANPIFMSKDTRLLEAIVKYMKFKKMVGVPDGMPVNESDMRKVLDMYRLYDIVYMEQLLIGIQTKTSPKMIEEFNERMEKFDDQFKITDIKVDYPNSDILYSSDTKTDVSVTTIGAGHQALVNMMLATTYANI